MIDTINTQRVNRRIYMYQRFIPSSENRSLAPVLIMVAIGDIKSKADPGIASYENQLRRLYQILFMVE